MSDANPLILSVWVTGEPKPQPRPRAFARRFGTQWQARVYDAGTAEGWKAAVALALKPVLPAAPLQGPVHLALVLHLPRPKRLCRKCDPPGLIPKDGKPDADNYAKAIMDAMTQLGVWQDDGQVARLEVSKYFAAREGRAGASIEVRRM